MDNLYLIAAFIALVFGAWIGHSGLRRWQQRHQPMTKAIEAQTSPVTDFRWRPQLETAFGILLILWALRIFVLFGVSSFLKPGVASQNPVTGRMETLPTSRADKDVEKTEEKKLRTDQ